MSFSFRDRPSLRDRLRGKSGDEIMEELKHSIDQDRKKFFESRPNWKQSPASSAFSKGFPFDDDIMPGNSKIQDHLEDIAQRHPELAEQLKSWSDLDRKDEVFDRQKEEEEKREEPGPLRGGNLRNTVPDMQSTSQTHDETDRGQRSQSAPPESKHGPNSGQFVSKVDISGKDNTQQNSSASMPQQDSSQQKVFHIPIYVEGRDEPILPKEVIDGPNATPRKNRTSRKPQPKPQQPPSQFEIPVDVQKQTHHQSQSPHPTQPSPPPPPSAQQQQQPVQQKDPLAEVAAVLEEVDSLKMKVAAFRGQSKDKEYMYLDEMLTRNLLKLDNIDTEGKEEVRSARKDAIKRIHECITQLETAPSLIPATTALVPLAQPDLTSVASVTPTNSTSEISTTTTTATDSDDQMLQQDQVMEVVPQNESST